MELIIHVLIIDAILRDGLINTHNAVRVSWLTMLNGLDKVIAIYLGCCCSQL